MKQKPTVIIPKVTMPQARFVREKDNALEHPPVKVSLSKRAAGLRKTPPGKPPAGYRWLRRGEEVISSDRIFNVEDGTTYRVSDSIGQRAGDHPSDFGENGYLSPFIRRKPAKEPVAKKARATFSPADDRHNREFRQLDAPSQARETAKGNGLRGVAKKASASSALKLKPRVLHVWPQHFGYASLHINAFKQKQGFGEQVPVLCIPLTAECVEALRIKVTELRRKNAGSRELLSALGIRAAKSKDAR